MEDAHPAVRKPTGPGAKGISRSFKRLRRGRPRRGNTARDLGNDPREDKLAPEIRRHKLVLSKGTPSRNWRALGGDLSRTTRSGGTRGCLGRVGKFLKRPKAKQSGLRRFARGRCGKSSAPAAGKTFGGSLTLCTHPRKSGPFLPQSAWLKATRICFPSSSYRPASKLPDLPADT